MVIGNIEILPMEYGRFKLDGGAMFGVVPKVLWQKYSPADENNQINMPLRAMLIKTGDRNILVDTGVGHKMSDKLTKIFSVDFTAFSLVESLKSYNLSFDDISDVILTHLHFDHTGGATKKNEKNEIVPTFPNATYYVQKKQYDWALNPSERDKASYFLENYVPLFENDVLTLIEGDKEILPGISALPIYGHTPGQQLVKISSGGQIVLFCGDLIPTAAHIPLPWIMSYDLQPLVTLEEKKKLLPTVVEENWTLFYEHDPQNIATSVLHDEKGYRMGEKVL
jgi:glyoxylase-like metal-dependent hydrolase (beta-lactamase superfamily II)